jgi:hypothetical protein
VFRNPTINFPSICNVVRYYIISSFLFLLFKTWFVATARSSVELFDTKSNVFPRRLRARLQVVNRDSLSPEGTARTWWCVPPYSPAGVCIQNMVMCSSIHSCRGVHSERGDVFLHTFLQGCAFRRKESEFYCPVLTEEVPVRLYGAVQILLCCC